MREILEKIFTEKVRFHLGIAISIIVVLLLLVNWILRGYTHHGEKITVPDVKGKLFDDAEAIIEDADLEVQVLDSAYKAELPPNSILDQTPKAGMEVKGGRTIYLTLNAFTVPTVELPDLVGKSSYKYAKMQLESYGLTVGEPVYKASPHEGALLDILYNGASISAKTKLKKGTKVTLVVGQGAYGSEVQIPYLIGLTYAEAVSRLNEYGLVVGAIIADDGVTDTQNAIVYRQSPEFSDGQTLRAGTEIDLFVGSSLPSDVKVNPDYYSVRKDTTTP